MRVLLASGLEGIGLGGVQTETRQLVAGLRTAGVAAGVLVNRLPDDVAHGVEHFPIDYPPAPATTGPAVAAAVAAFRPDVVHVIGGGLSFVRTAERAAAGVPCAVTVHNVPPAEQVGRFLYGWNGGHYLLRNARSLASAASWQWYLRAASRFAKAVCHSELVYRRVVAAVRDPGRVALIRLSGHQDLADAAAPAADAPAQYPSPFPLDAHPKLLTVGGIVHHKGLHDGIRAVRQLAGEFPRIHYHIIGQTRDGRYRNYVKRLVAAADV
ncbi:MAG TPA: glycosyltransferase, partial [Tepidisphaeraceae bacterium]|nr:glycosyltransferase [Tepidisphaeraceae bacterium]